MNNDAAFYVPHFARLLEAQGFMQVRERRWIRNTKAPVREIFQIQAMKGLTYSARWGFSLDFVPLFRRHKLRSKRTDKSADFDLCIDPIDESGSLPDWCSFPQSRYSTTLLTAGDIARRSTDAAHADFASVSSILDIIALFERRSRRAFRRFGLDNYTQTDLAWGLALAFVGKTVEAEDHLTRFCRRFDLQRDELLLVKAYSEASGFPRWPCID